MMMLLSDMNLSNIRSRSNMLMERGIMTRNTAGDGDDGDHDSRSPPIQIVQSREIQ